MKRNHRLPQTAALLLVLAGSGTYLAQADLSDGLIAYWPLNGSANDATTNGHNGIVATQTLAQDHFGIANGAYHFDGSGYIAVPDSDAFTLGSSPFTIAAWAQFDTFGADGGYYLMGHSAGPGTTAKWIFWLGNGGIQFIAAPVYWINLGPYSFQLNRWYHIAVRRRANELTAFVNGVPIGTNSISAAIPNPNAPLFIGSGECCDRPNRPFRGSIDDVRIYNRALSDEELRSLQDFALLALDSPIVRTQQTACISMTGIAPSSTPAGASFTVQAPAGHLTNLFLNLTGCWSGTVTPLPNAKWSVLMQSDCTNAPMGAQSIGTLCFTAISEHSAFVPITFTNLMVTNLDGSLPLAYTYASRIVVVANEPLLEAWLGQDKARMATLYGIAGKWYSVLQTTNVSLPRATWTPGWVVTTPGNLFTNFPITGAASNAPVLFLCGHEEEPGYCLCDPLP